MIDFQGAKITSDAGVLMLREVDERFDIIGPMEDSIDDSRSPRHTRHTMGVLAYNLLYLIREFYLFGEEVRRSIEWMIRRLIKVGAKVAYHARQWHVHVTSAFPLASLYRAVFSYS